MSLLRIAIAAIASVTFLWLLEAASERLSKTKITKEQRLARRLVCLVDLLGVVCSAILGRYIIDRYAEQIALQIYCNLWIVAPFWMLVKYVAHKYYPSGKADSSWRLSIFKRCILVAALCAVFYFWHTLALPREFGKYALWASLQLLILSGGRLITLDWYVDNSGQQIPRKISDKQEPVIRELHMSHREDVRSTSVQVLQILTLFFTAASIASGWFVSSLIQSHINSAKDLSGYNALVVRFDEQYKQKPAEEIGSVNKATGRIIYTKAMQRELDLLSAADEESGTIIKSRLLNSGSFAAMLATLSIMLSSLIATIGALGLTLSVRRTGIGELSRYTLNHFGMLPASTK